jgi:hypothetical protein
LKLFQHRLTFKSSADPRGDVVQFYVFPFKDDTAFYRGVVDPYWVAREGEEPNCHAVHFPTPLCSNTRWHNSTQVIGSGRLVHIPLTLLSKEVHSLFLLPLAALNLQDFCPYMWLLIEIDVLWMTERSAYSQLTVDE